MWLRFSVNEMNNLETRSVLNTYAEGQRYFMGEGQLNNALARLVADLKEHDIDYLVIDAVALLAYGYPRFTEDIDLILDENGIDRFHRELSSEFAKTLNPYVREKFLELLEAVQRGSRNDIEE